MYIFYFGKLLLIFDLRVPVSASGFLSLTLKVLNSSTLLRLLQIFRDSEIIRRE